jgi:hypothetical protein
MLLNSDIQFIYFSNNFTFSKGNLYIIDFFEK